MWLHEITKVSTLGWDQTQNSREKPKCDHDLVTEQRCDTCDILFPEKGILWQVLP